MVVLVMDEDGLTALFFALSDPLRRRVLEAVSQSPDATVTDICNAFEVSRFSVMRHLNVLEESGLITRTASGRERRVRLSDEAFEDGLIDWLHKLRKGKCNENLA